MHINKKILETFLAILFIYIIKIASANCSPADVDKSNTNLKEIKSTKKKSWSITPKTGFTYNSNVFRLDESDKDDMLEPGDDDTENGRFSDMNSIDDLIITLL